MTPPVSALNGDYGIVQVRCRLNSYSPPFPILMTGGIIYKLIVGEPGDVGVTQIKEPSGTILPGTPITPRAVVKNFGATVQTFSVKFTIDDVYTDDSSNIILNLAETLAIDFNQWPAVIGDYTASCSTQLNNDWRTYNDKASVSFSVATAQATGWAPKESIPPASDLKQGKYVKDGGSIVAVGNNLYAFPGNKSWYFYKYSAGDWDSIGHIPYGIKPGSEPPAENKKKIGKGASLCYDNVNQVIYATKGNGTKEFWAYSLTDDVGWTAKAFVPTMKVLKGGTSIAYLNGKVYLLAGGHKPTDTTNFYCYNTATNIWTKATKVLCDPTYKPWKDGSCITEMNGKIYALKGGDKIHYFCAYDTSIQTWTTDSIPEGDSLYGKWKKVKVKDGAAMTSGNNAIYAIKGGGTNVFRKYTTTGGWTRLESIPRLQKKSVPKTGAALAYANDAVWLLKGNNTPEFWRYIPPGKSKSQIPISKQIQNPNVQIKTGAERLAESGMRIAVNPNPFTNNTTIRYAVSISGKVSIKLYNATGSLVKTFHNGYLNAGSYTLNLSNISSGVYFLRYKTNTNQAEVKLIVQ